MERTEVRNTLGVDRVYVISASEERREYMSPLLDLLNVDYEIFQGYTNRNPSLQRLVTKIMAWSNVQHPLAWNWASENSIAGISGRLGSTSSHIAVWKHMVARKIDTAVIMEDDVDIHIDIEKTIREVLADLQGEWDILYLGWCSTVWPPQKGWSAVPPLDNVTHQRLSRSACAHGYMVNRRGIEVLLNRPEFIEPDYRTPLDVHLAHMIVDGVLNPVYGFTPAMVKQRPLSPDHPSLLEIAAGGRINDSDIKTPERLAPYSIPYDKESSVAYRAGVSYWHT